MDKLFSKYAKPLAFCVLLISIVLMGVIIYEVSKTKKNFATNLISQSIQQTKNEINSFFTPIQYLLLSEKNQLERDNDSQLSPRDLNLRFIPLINNLAQISSIAVSDVRGYEHNIIPDTLESGWLNRFIFVDRWGPVEKWERFNFTDSLVQVNTWEEKVTIDPRERPWFKGAVENKGKVHWTKPYRYTTEGQFGITASVQYREKFEPDDFSKILAFDLTLSDINEFVKDLELTENQNVFLLTEDNSSVISQHHATNDRYIDQSNESILQSPAGMENSALINVLQKSDNQEAFEFEINGTDWWGIMTPYYLSSSQAFNIVTVLPEKDFSEEIDRTQWIILFCFSLILFSSVVIVINHNKLHRIGGILVEKNKLISKQKDILFSEVHHRVKNNLALIGAFLELDRMETGDESANNLLVANKNRIKVIAQAQELAYQSEKLGTVPLNGLVEKIVSNYSELAIDLRTQTEKIAINVNQAQSYALLLNELLAFNIQQDEKAAISLDIFVEDGQIHTRLTAKNSAKKDRDIRDVQERPIVKTQLAQLHANHKIKMKPDTSLTFSFQLKDIKGTAGNKYYPKYN